MILFRVLICRSNHNFLGNYDPSRQNLPGNQGFEVLISRGLNFPLHRKWIEEIFIINTTLFFLRSHRFWLFTYSIKSYWQETIFFPFLVTMMKLNFKWLTWKGYLNFCALSCYTWRPWWNVTEFTSNIIYFDFWFSIVKVRI